MARAHAHRVSTRQKEGSSGVIGKANSGGGSDDDDGDKEHVSRGKTISAAAGLKDEESERWSACGKESASGGR